MLGVPSAEDAVMVLDSTWTTPGVFEVLLPGHHPMAELCGQTWWPFLLQKPYQPFLQPTEITSGRQPARYFQTLRHQQGPVQVSSPHPVVQNLGEPTAPRVNENGVWRTVKGPGLHYRVSLHIA